MQTLRAGVARWVPEEVLHWDPKLHHLTAGVRYQVQNSQLLLSNWGEGPGSSLLIDNAVQGCHSYLKLFRNRLIFFTALFWSFLATSVTLTVSALLFIVPSTKSKGRPHVHSDTNHPRSSRGHHH